MVFLRKIQVLLGKVPPKTWLRSLRTRDIFRWIAKKQFNQKIRF